MSTSDQPPFEADHSLQLCMAWSATCAGPVQDIQISPNGVVAVATESGICLYSGDRDFALRHELYTSPATLTAFEFSGAGREVITGANDGFLKWWDVSTGDEICSTQFPVTKAGDDQEEELAAEAPAVSALACSQQGELVAATGGRTVCIFGHGGVHLHTIGPLIAPVIAMEWHGTSELAVNLGSGIQLFSITEERFDVGQGLGAEVDGASLTTVAAAPGGRLLAAGCTNGMVMMWNLENEEGDSFKCFQNTDDVQIDRLAWDETGNFLATAGGREVIVWDMSDNNGEPRDGKDDCIVCYGHDREAKITALAFQPHGTLLATGGDDCQVLVFDSTDFSSNRENVGRGLVGPLSSGRVAREGVGVVVTAVAWHPSGLVLAGTSTGKVAAFEVVPGLDGTTSREEKTPAEVAFLFPSPDGTRGPRVPIPEHAAPMGRRRTLGQPSTPGCGWGGEPLITNSGGPENQHMKDDTYFGPRQRVNGSGGNVNLPGRRGPRHQERSRAKDIFNQVKSGQMSRPPYAEGAQQPWQTMMHPGMGMMQWPPAMAFAPQMQYSQFIPSQMPQTPVMRPYNPHASPAQMPGGPSMMPRMPVPPPQGSQFPVAYMPYPQAYPMGYPPQYAYYPHMGAQPLQEQMSGQPAPAMGPAGMPNAASQMTPKRPSNGIQREGSSPDLNDAASKSSERTNNGVNGLGPVTPSESSTSYEQDNGRMAHGVVTLYIGNLAPQVDENQLFSCFAPFGQIINVQVIRDRETNQSRGFAFITYGHPVWAQNAMTSMDGVAIHGPFEGRRMKVSLSNRRP